MQITQLYFNLQRMGILGYMGLSSLVFTPPFVITREEIDTIVEQARNLLKAVRLRNGTMELA
jgi:adenosylmethionine-8-amino-7-oxononanoate aminotransferase